MKAGRFRRALSAPRSRRAGWSRRPSCSALPGSCPGEVIHGDKRGRELGFPTANIRLDPACGLKHGIYAVRGRFAGELHDGVASFGRRPTFDDGAPLLEVFLFDFDGDLYGQIIDVAFIGWIRAGKVRLDRDLMRHMNADAAQAARWRWRAFRARRYA